MMTAGAYSKMQGFFNPLSKACHLHPVRQKAFRFEMLTNVRQIFWKTEGVNTARLPFFVGGGGCFIGSGFSFHSTQQSNVNLVFSVSPPS